ncbi:MAG: ThiF family adenylyltransferase [Alphaproteobacteria bacterium]|nr:ThiF family adenylyltransferase [Alphaproteobacteria bacterium]
MAWWRRDPGRWARELADLERCFPRLRLLELGADARGLEGFVRVGEAERFIRLLWPEAYPHQPPLLIEAQPFSDAPAEADTGFVRFRDGALCLYTHDDGQEAWTPERDTVDTIQRYRDFRDHDEQPIVDMRQDAAAQLLRVTLRVPPGLAEVTRTPKGYGVLHVRTRERLGAWLVVRAVCEAPPVGPVTWSHDARWSPMMVRPQVQVMPWVSVTLQGRRWAEALPDDAALVALLEAQLPATEASAFAKAPLLVLSRVEGERADLLLVVRGPDGALRGSAPAVVEDPHDQLFRRVDGALSGRERLREAQVVMVGLGSLGSAVAVELACAGVGRFLLLDGERLGPENVCRHAASLPHVDAFKVQAVAELLLTRNPDAEVRTFDRGLFWDTEPVLPEAGQAFRGALLDPRTLVLVSTATHGLEQAVNRACVDAGRDAVYAAVLGEAEYGRVFRVRPGQGPCYRCVVDQQRAEPRRFPRFLAAEGAARPGRGAYSQPGIPGLGLDVRQVALLAARVALAALLEGDADAPVVPGDHLLWSNRAGWVFEQALSLRVEPYVRQEGCPVCGEHVSEAPDSEAIQALEARLRAPERMAPGVVWGEQ